MPNTALHSYVYLVLRMTGNTFSDLAQNSVCSPKTISAVLLGQKKSKRIQEDIALQLGFGSWEQLKSEAQRFYDDFISRYEEARVCG
ncbi:MAG: hypothetical protein II903_09270 [Spirochaetales bacterium]|nr:hypothetical protein [Spirochaetales bacterium]